MLRATLRYRSFQNEDATVNLAFSNTSTNTQDSLLVQVADSDWKTELALQGYSLWCEGGLALIARVLRISRHAAPSQLKDVRPSFMQMDVWFTPRLGGFDDILVTTLTYERRTLTEARICGIGQAGVGHGPMETKETADVLEEAAKACVMLGFEVASGSFPKRPELRSLRNAAGEEFVYFEDVPPGVMTWFRAFVAAYFPKAFYRNEAMTDLAAWEAFCQVAHHRKASTIGSGYECP